MIPASLDLPIVLGTLRFAGEMPAVVVLSLALIAAVAVMCFYARETRRLAAPYSYLLPALRASAVAMVIIILAGPVWHRRQVVGTLGRVVFAVDTSASMSAADSSTVDPDAMRIRRATRLLSGTEQYPGLIERLQQTHKIEVVAFDSANAVPIWTSDSQQSLDSALQLSANARRTNLASPLESSLLGLGEPDINASDVDVGGENGDRVSRSAIVILSDGRHNLGRSPLEAAERYRSTGVRVVTVGMGSQEEPADAGIAEVIRPDSVAADGRLSGRLLVKQFGMYGKPLDLRIEHLGETVWQKTVAADADGELAVPFEIDVEPLVRTLQSESARGVRRNAVALDLRAVVDAPELVQSAGDEMHFADIMAQNNEMSFRVAASTRQRRLLIVDGSSRWEVRYIRNLFERDPAWKVDTVLFGPGTDSATLKRGDKAGEFPASLEQISVFDAVILGEAPENLFSSADSYLIRQFVARGGGLIVIDGRYDRLRQLIPKELSDVIPVKYLSGDNVVKASEVVPSGIGAEHPAMNLIGSTADVSLMWKNFPSPEYAVPVEAQPGAEVWANVILEQGAVSPWLVTRLFGAGRVFYLSSDQTWRWRYKLADELHARFWNQLLGAVMQPPYSASDAFVALGTDKVQYATGESSLVRVRLQDPLGKPLGDATVDALLVKDDRVVATVPLAIDHPSRGTYQGLTPPLEAGHYQLRIRASGFDSSALQATTPIWVGSQDHIELRRVGLDKNSLTQVAQAGGGQYFHESSAEQLLDSLKPLSSGSIIESDLLLWQSYYWFWLIILLLTIEWLLRKRAGLI